MRRPHPRFDERRSAWVTNAGGRLKTLASGPRNADTEAAAWDAFYRHMALLGQPVEGAPTPQLSLGELADEYGRWMDLEVAADRMKAGTQAYYTHFLQKFLDTVGGTRPATSILPIELERYKSNWHSVQTVQRLFNWGVKMGLIDRNPLKDVSRPEPGARERVLSREEAARLLRHADRTFRHFLFAMLHTIARPQEIRALQWKHLVNQPAPMFVLTDFKGKKLRKGNKGVRTILLDPAMLRLLERLVRKRSPAPEDFVFLNARGQQWTGNAVRCRMRRLRERAGFQPDENGEQVVSYTLRHSAGTRATAQGVMDRRLADLMGHTDTATTRRYQHLQAEHLHDAILQANKRKNQ